MSKGEVQHRSLKHGVDTRNRFDGLLDETDYEEIIVIGDYNVTSLKSSQRKVRAQLKILGKPDLLIDEIEGIFQIIIMENIPSNKPIILQVGAKDVAKTEETRKKYETLLTNGRSHGTSVYDNFSIGLVLFRHVKMNKNHVSALFLLFMKDL